MDLEERMKSSAGLSNTCVLIIVVASVERFAYKGVASNLLSYLTEHVKMSTSSAAKSVSTWIGVTSMLPLVSAILTDSYWNRYSTIMASSLLYIVGLVGLTSWVLLCAWMPSSSLFLPLYLISIGQGGYNPSLQAFGADQLETEEGLPCSGGEEIRSNKKSLFFQWWYFGICSGSLLGNSIMSYIQDTIGWGLGFAIPTGAMAVSVVCFLCGSRFYVHKQLKLPNRPMESILQAAKLVAANLKSRSKVILPPCGDGGTVELELQQKPLKSDADCSPSSDAADEPPGVARTMLRLLPIWTMLLMFAVIFQQPVTFFTKQGMMMKRSIGSHFSVPPAMLQSSITISIILIMPVYDKLIIPCLRRLTGQDKGVSVLQRIGIGMCLSVVAMAVAALVESRRIRINLRPLGGREVESQLSIFWLLPQYVLLGISDVFTVVGMQEFFYMEVPATMRTIGIALYLSVFGVGSFLSALLISALELVSEASGKHHRSWFSDDAREARLDNYYWFLAALSFICFIVFAYLCRFYNNPNASGNRK